MVVGDGLEMSRVHGTNATDTNPTLLGADWLKGERGLTNLAYHAVQAY